VELKGSEIIHDLGHPHGARFIDWKTLSVVGRGRASMGRGAVGVLTSVSHF